jgi:aldehyde:ferredoxin oxidoreductase
MTRVPIDGGTPKELTEKWLGEGGKKIYDLHYWGKEVAHAVIRHEEFSSVLDSMVACNVGNFSGSLGISYYTGRGFLALRDDLDWVNFTPNGGMEYMSAIMGRDYSYEEINRVGDRITNLIRAIWVRDGYTTVDDPVWPKAVDMLWDMHYERTDPEGVNLTDRAGFLSAQQDYYAERGWVDGVPTRATLEEYGLADVAKELEQRGLMPKS